MAKITLCFTFLTLVFAVLAQDRSVNTVGFTVFHRNTHKFGQPIQPTTASVNQFSTFRPETTIIIHDINGSAYDGINPTLKNAYLTSQDISIIVVDWSIIAGLGVNNAINQAPTIGEYIASLVRLLIARNQINLIRLHLVGFGIGAHIAAFTSRSLGRGVARITALDPTPWAGFTALNMEDALYVEAIHTDIPSSPSDTAATGTAAVMGDIDFFPNGGLSQPGCNEDNECNHNRSWLFFAASLTDGGLMGNQCGIRSNVQIQPDDIRANKCDGVTVAMGTNLMTKFHNGVYFVRTSNAYPYKVNCIRQCVDDPEDEEPPPATVGFE